MPRALQRLHYNWHRHYDPSLGRYTQPDPLGFVDGPSVYAYAGNSPNKLVDRMGLKTTLVCRPVQDKIARLFGAKHCAVFVWRSRDSTQCGKKTKVIDAQFSLAGGRKPQTDPNAPTYSADRDSFISPKDSTEFYDIAPPSPQTQQEFDHAVIESGNNYSQPPYDAVFGPNSNTASDNILEGAGGSVPDVDGAYQQNWGERWGEFSFPPIGP
ncbi:MAG: RHS repeat-associated core domain-containing protein [Hyphomicrobium sp.]|nr:RHS repeat-associated core domain-containing protein [Hyphomicrobium sp.]